MSQLLKSVFIFIVLTVLTQVGGLAYLLYKPFSNSIKQTSGSNSGFAERLLFFTAIYCGLSFFLTPYIAQRFDRVRLPLFADEVVPLAPRNLVYYFTNRNYVSRDLYKTTLSVARSIAETYPGTELLYLDGNFPFLDGFPLLPHRSHDDGNKLDLCFLYKDKSGERVNATPVFLGYGGSEEPRSKEKNQPAACEKKGKWQYSIMRKILSPLHSSSYELDEKATRKLLQLIAKEKQIKKIFIEPHLKTRLRLGSVSKIRFQGCDAVRHDDHIHIEM